MPRSLKLQWQPVQLVLEWQLAEPQQVLVGELVQQLARLVQQQVLLAQLEQPQESLESLLEKRQLE
jgi:hypothetical protein